MRWSLVFLSFLLAAPHYKALAKELGSDFKEVLSEDDAPGGSEKDPAKNSQESVQASSLKENEALLSGHVRVMRKIDKTEVFFKDLKDSYIIPSGSSYGGLFKAFEQSQKKGTTVHFKANIKTRQILSLESAPSQVSPAGRAGSQ